MVHDVFDAILTHHVVGDDQLLILLCIIKEKEKARKSTLALYQTLENFWTISFGNVEESLILSDSIPLDMLFEKVGPKVGGKT